MIRPLAYVVTAVCFGAVVYYGVIFKGQLPDHPLLRGKNDLFLHFCAFLVLAIPVRLLWAGWLSLLALTSCAAAIEVIQIFQPERTAALDDLAASLLGLSIGAALIALSRRSMYRTSKPNHE